MEKQYELITKGEEVFLLNEDTETVSLKKAVGIIAMDTYAKSINLLHENDNQKKEGLKEQIVFQSNLLNSLSNALNAINS